MSARFSAAWRTDAAASPPSACAIFALPRPSGKPEGRRAGNPLSPCGRGCPSRSREARERYRVEGQEGIEGRVGLKGVPCLTTAWARTRSFRATATRTSLGDFPVAARRAAKSLRTGLARLAESAQSTIVERTRALPTRLMGLDV